MVNNKQTPEKSGVNPLAVGAAVVAGGVAGAAIATALSDKDTRKKLGKKMRDFRASAVQMIEEMKDATEEASSKSKIKVLETRSKIAGVIDPKSKVKKSKKSS